MKPFCFGFVLSCKCWASMHPDSPSSSMQSCRLLPPIWSLPGTSFALAAPFSRTSKSTGSSRAALPPLRCMSRVQKAEAHALMASLGNSSVAVLAPSAACLVPAPHPCLPLCYHTWADGFHSPAPVSYVLASPLLAGTWDCLSWSRVGVHLSGTQGLV